MSYCAIIPIRDCMPQAQVEFRNAWGGAARIWEALFEKYIKDENTPYHSWLCAESHQKLWDLAKDTRLSLMERAVHASTFDRAYICRSEFSRFATDLRDFDKLYPATGSQVNHLQAWADFIQSLDADAVGFYGTSVSENTWWRYNEASDETYATPLSDCFDVYEWIDTEVPTP